MDFFYSYIILAEIYVILGLSTNLLVGIAGIFSVSQAAVFGVGAYVVGACLLGNAIGFLPALLIAGVSCLALNVITVLPLLRVARLRRAPFSSTAWLLRTPDCPSAASAQRRDDAGGSADPPGGTRQPQARREATALEDSGASPTARVLTSPQLSAGDKRPCGWR
jgi:hypothetical protein